jgi:molybdopterin molybdotransferase
MDGYAIHAQDCGTSNSLTVIGTHVTGAPATLTLAPGQAVRIFTGAPIPAGTGAVVMQEDVDASNLPLIKINVPAAPGEFIRRTGADVCQGQILLTPGQRLTPGHLALMAAQGLTHIPVRPLPNIGILTTGSELLPLGQTATHPAQIYDSNGPMLQALLQHHGLAANVTLAHAADSLDAISHRMTELLETASVLICIGGVSVGDHDLVKPALAKLGVTTEFWRVAMKPGKPFLFGQYQGKPVFGLPGNPVSAYVTAYLLVLPALRKLAGSHSPHPATVAATLAQSMDNTDTRLTYFRGHWDASAATFTPLGLQESHALYGLSQATALLPIPGNTALAAGSAVQIHPLA